MTCAAFARLAVALARGEDVPPAGREDALAHARACPRCAARLEAEQEVAAALLALASRTAAAEAPARVEWALRRVLRERERPSGEGAARHARLFRAVEMGLVASAALLAAVAVVPRPSVPGAGPGPARPSAVSAGPVRLVADGPEFVSLRYGEDLRDLDGLQVIEVEVPRTALAAFGWPAGESHTGAVTAEVIVGHDGVARAIRLVE